MKLEELSQPEVKGAVADAMNIAEDEILKARVDVEQDCIFAVTAAGQKVRVDENGVLILCGPGMPVEELQAPAPAPAVEEPAELAPLADEPLSETVGPAGERVIQYDDRTEVIPPEGDGDQAPPAPKREKKREKKGSAKAKASGSAKKSRRSKKSK